MAPPPARFAAIAIALPWGAAWTAFGLASGLGESLDGLGLAMHTLLPGGAGLLIAGVACLNARIGAWLLLAAGAVFAVGYPFMARPQFTWGVVLFMEAALALPPLVEGGLLLRSVHISRCAL